MTHRLLDQPRSVYAVAFACVVAFMGIGLVDPILPVLARDLEATILAYTPLLLGMTAHQLGLIYFGWGVLVALTSVFGAQRLERRYGLVPVLGVTLALVAVMAAAA
jgi:hypothetical protein